MGTLPKRKSLSHVAPPFVSGSPLYFLTVCGALRGSNQFATKESWGAIKAATAHYHAIRRWHVWLLLAMPDHLHLLVVIPRDVVLAEIVASWKRYLARTHGMVWQRDFFDHRIRSTENLDEKSTYIRLNPVRAGLCKTVDEWAYWWQPDDVAMTSII